MSIAGPAFRLIEERIPAVAQSVVKAANELSIELGYKEAQPEKKSAEIKPIRVAL